MKEKLIPLAGALATAGAMAGGLAGEPAVQSSGAYAAAPGQHLRSDDPRLSERARRLIRIGEVGIARQDDAALDAYFARDFTFHGPGADASYPQLKAAFAAYRAAFTDFRVSREMIVESGALVGARTRMSGTFTRAFETPFGVAAPTGQYVEWELVNVFRYDADGRLAEEWVQYDTVGLMRKLGIELAPQARKR